MKALRFGHVNKTPAEITLRLICNPKIGDPNNSGESGQERMKSGRAYRLSQSTNDFQPRDHSGELFLSKVAQGQPKVILEVLKRKPLPCYVLYREQHRTPNRCDQFLSSPCLPF